MTHSLYLVIVKKPGWKKFGVKKVARWRPELQPEQVAVQLQIDIPENILDAPSVPIRINEGNIIRPTVSVS